MMMTDLMSTAATLDNVVIGDNNMTKVKFNADQEDQIITEVQSKETKYEVEEPIGSGRTQNYIKIDPIYFEFDKWSLSDSELTQLDKVVQIMKDNPAIIVEAGAHTDSKNREAYNQILV